MNPSDRCTVPPEGWYCTREPGHDGPCAAWPEDLIPEELPDDVLRYAMECAKQNNPAGARLVKAIWSAIRDGLLHPVAPDCGACPGDGTVCPRECKLKADSPRAGDDTELLAGQTWQAPVVGTDGKLKVVEGKFGKQPCSDLSAQLRAMADAVDRGEIVDFVSCCVQDGGYETFFAASLQSALTLSTLLHRRCVDRFFAEDGS